MEVPETGYGKYGLGEEELTLTPHHTPSQSFDFIVWEKAYLDSIPAGAPASSSRTIDTNKATKGPPTKGDFAEASITKSFSHIWTCSSHSTSEVELDAEPPWLRPPLTHSSSENDAALMACRTDADLPSCFFGYTPRVFDEGTSCVAACGCEKKYMPHRHSGLTILEEAVINYVEEHQRRTAPPSRGCSRRHAGCSTLDNYKQLTDNMRGDDGTQDHLFNGCPRPGTNTANTLTSQYDSAAHFVNKLYKPRAHDHSSSNVKILSEALLKRSVSQPGGSKAWITATCEADAGVDNVFDMKSSATELKPTPKHSSAGQVVGIYHDQCNPGQPQDGAKMPCFPASRIGSSPGRRKHSRSTIDDRELSDIAGKHSNRAPSPMRHQGKFMSPAYKPTLYMHQQKGKLSPTKWADLIDIPAGGAAASTSPRYLAPKQPLAGCYRSSFSDVSSLSSSDHHGATIMSKLRLWGLHHKIKSLCRKFCSSCPNFSHSSSMSADFKR